MTDTIIDVKDSLRRTIEAMDFPGPIAVSQFLRANHITGLRQKSRQCPIARYLTSVVGVPVSVNSITAWAWVTSEVDVEYELPAPVKTFIKCFDEGEFPDLVEMP
jgi:hypothetical protein